MHFLFCNISCTCYFEKLNSKVRDLSLVNQRQETSTVINWFRKIKNKKKMYFYAI